MFAFGYGLSYTQFALENIALDKASYTSGEVLNLTCDLSNIGDIAGSEVVQVYVGKADGSKVERAVKELKGFSKQYLTAGEKTQVAIQVPINSLRFFNEEKDQWELETGNYKVFVGTASNQIKAEIPVMIQEEVLA